MSSKYKILVIEDENNIRNFIETILNANDYQTLPAASYEQGLLMYASHTPDLVMLDLGLPDKDGIEFIRFIRKTDATPIIVLSARTGESDKIEALDLGANDYITKPFGTGELLARVRATLRNNRPGMSAGSLPGEKFSLYDLIIDYDRRMVFIGEEEIKLTQTEYNILALLSYHTGKVMTYAAIIKEIWGSSDDGSIKKLQVNMANIRKKLGSKPGDNQYIINELGVGYRMNEENI
ncbi:MAG: response regulator transcription factor [Lachnospiraceae bacterium]|nr:response regulator transcription factor [Lachnospiraceae bacterium]